uniref:NADH-ubiquinone oxidoreductase chain 6 n=1 Tax=Pangshura sylhetensis TaxID=429326 RepID=A0A6N0A0W9_9SAUR|nr:NADH dehydrogenase subunit 6 [Pangshura sylhetensis]
MMYFMSLLGFCFVFWMVGVSCSWSPYYGVMSLVFGAFFGCVMLVSAGGSFVSLLLFLIYLGGMLVIFAYSSALVGEVHPVAWMEEEGMFYGVYYFLVALGLVGAGFILWHEGIGSNTTDNDGFYVVRSDFSGVSWLYYFGSGLLLIAGWALLLTLFVVLELVRGLSRGAIRAI